MVRYAQLQQPAEDIQVSSLLYIHNGTEAYYFFFCYPLHVSFLLHTKSKDSQKVG